MPPRPHRGGTSPRYALQSLRELFGHTVAIEFGPKALKKLCGTWVNDGLSRKVVNGRSGAVKRLFKWAVNEELVPAEAYHRLATVEGLRTGRTEAPDRQPVRCSPRSCSGPGGPDEFLFGPARAEADRNADRPADRKTPK